MNKRTWLIAGALAAALAALGWAFAPRPVAVELATAAVGPFELTIDEDGRTRLPERYVISAPLAGRVGRIALRAGDVVSAGATVATLTPVLPPLLDERAAREAQARVEGAQALLQRAVVRIERARVAVEQAGNELERSEQLARDGFIAPTRLEGDRLTARAAARELDAAQQDRHVAQHDLEQARAAVGAMRRPGSASARAFDVRSPIAGQVLRVAQASEGTVGLGAPLVEVGQLDTLEVVVELLTTDAPRAQTGAAVRFERWGGQGALEGRVKRVEPSAFTKVSALGVEEQRVNLIADIATPRDRWRALGDGFRVGARIVVSAVDEALLIPSSAVFPMPGEDDRQMAVFVVDGGRAKLTPVTLAGRNATSAWIGKGLDAGAKVIVYPPAAVRDGVRVRERQV